MGYKLSAFLRTCGLEKAFQIIPENKSTFMPK